MLSIVLELGPSSFWTINLLSKVSRFIIFLLDRIGLVPNTIMFIDKHGKMPVKILEG